MFKNIKSLFIVEEEPKKEVAKSVAKDPPKPATEATPDIPSGQASQEFMDILFKAMQDNNIEGFDYLEFKKSLLSLKQMQMDEPTRYQSAFAMAQTLGATPEKLVQTAQHYLDVLKNEEQKFQKAAANQQEKLIGTREQEIAQIDAALKTKAEQIKQLTQEIEQHQQQAAALKKEIAEATIKVETTKHNFVASYQQLAAQIAADIENIKEYLK
ncbi:MAG: hypothetical protein SFU99_07100 [Saprospiraceae bacterium]|nr:hypothetical protein [Saprospiraceae bacterium]